MSQLSHDCLPFGQKFAFSSSHYTSGSHPRFALSVRILLVRYFAVRKLPNPTSNRVPVLMTSEPSHVDLSDIDFTVQDVSNALFKLRIDKAAGADDLSPRFMLQLKDYTAYPLYLLFRKSLDEGSVPADWKCANISPIYNKRSK